MRRAQSFQEQLRQGTPGPRSESSSHRSLPQGSSPPNGFSRRRWLVAGAGGLACLVHGLAHNLRSQSIDDSPAGSELRCEDWPIIGAITPVPSREIEASRLSVGFEVLDRQLFDPMRTYPFLANLGVKWARCQTGWCRCETRPGHYDFTWLDEVVDNLLKIGIQPWFCLSYGNRLYIPQADETAVGWVPIYSEEASAAWVRFTRAIARHFAKRVRHWEIWNEPNISHFWKPAKPNPADYVKLVALTGPVIREAVPSAVIIGGALAGMPTGFLRECLEAGLASLVDKISYHPYRPVPEAGYAAQVATFRTLLAEHGPHLALWQGENGCPSQGGPESAGALADLAWDELRQAKWLLRRILIDLSLDLELTSYFHTVDLVGYRGITNFKGLLRGNDYSPKPAYFAYQRLCSLFDSRTLPLSEQVAHLELTPPGTLPKEEALVELHTIAKLLSQALVAAFTRQGRLIVAFWYPANLQQPWNPIDVTVLVEKRSEPVLAEPVLLNLLEGTIHAIPFVTSTSTHLRLENLPLMDFPLVIADRAALQATGRVG